MVDKIEMSLDDIIKSTKKTKPSGGSAGGGRRDGRRDGAARRNGGRRTGSPRKAVRGGRIEKAKSSRGDVNSAWKHDMYDGPKRGMTSLNSRSSTQQSSQSSKLLVSNLDYGVSDTDIQELFTEFGPMKKAAIHYDRSGRSLGTADVVFERRSDALKAIKQYNGVPLDGRAMDIQLTTSEVSSFARSGRLGGDNGAVSPLRRRQLSNVKRGGNRSEAPKRKPAQKPAGRGGRGPPPTAEELDAELDAYVNDMKI